MEPIRQVCRKIKVIFKYIIYYLVISFIIISLFALFYYFEGFKTPMESSIKVFWGISNNFTSESSFWTTAEILVSNLFNLIIVSSVLIKFLKPLNPIIVSNNVAYNNKTNRFKFCYWIMLPEGKFLFDINIRIFLTTCAAYQDGVNSLPVIWQSTDKDVENLRQARGIRYVQLSTKESKALYDLIKNKKATTLKYELGLVINGNDATGNRYYSWKRYKLINVFYGYQFVPLQKHEYTAEDFFTGNEDTINVQNYESHFPRELFRYQHFGKLFKLDNGENIKEKQEKKDILSKDKIVNGQYKWLKQKLLDFCSWIIMLFLDRSHWKSWWKNTKR